MINLVYGLLRNAILRTIWVDGGAQVVVAIVHIVLFNFHRLPSLVLFQGLVELAEDGLADIGIKHTIALPAQAEFYFSIPLGLVLGEVGFEKLKCVFHLIKYTSLNSKYERPW